MQRQYCPLPILLYVIYHFVPLLQYFQTIQEANLFQSSIPDLRGSIRRIPIVRAAAPRAFLPGPFLHGGNSVDLPLQAGLFVSDQCLLLVHLRKVFYRLVQQVLHAAGGNS